MPLAAKKLQEGGAKIVGFHERALSRIKNCTGLAGFDGSRTASACGIANISTPRAVEQFASHDG
jgi:hypothetical protein